MSFDLTETYDSPSTFNSSIVPEGTLTVSGSTNLDGTYTITSQNGGFAFFPAVGTILGFALNPDFAGGSTFSFGGVTVSAFNPTGASLTNVNPPVGAPVLASDFNDAFISIAPNPLSFLVDSGGDSSRYSFSSSQVTAVPEPSTYAALTGLAVVAFVVLRRRR